MSQTNTTNYYVRFFVRTPEGINSFRENFGTDLVRARNVYLKLREILPKEYHTFLALMKMTETCSTESIGE